MPRRGSGGLGLPVRLIRLRQPRVHEPSSHQRAHVPTGHGYASIDWYGEVVHVQGVIGYARIEEAPHLRSAAPPGLPKES